MGNKQLAPAQARELAINAEAVYQYYYKKHPQATQALVEQLVTEHAEVVAMLESTGVPSDSAKKSLLYQDVMRRQLSRVPAPTDAAVRAYYDRYSASINKPFDKVKAQLAISLTQPARSAHLEQWVRAIRQGCVIKLLELEAPSPPATPNVNSKGPGLLPL